MFRVATLMSRFVELTSLSTARNLYSALLCCPPLYALRFASILNRTKRSWNVAKPRYDAFYDVEKLLHSMTCEPLPSTEEDIRLRAIVLLRLVCLFKGIDLARANVLWTHHASLDAEVDPQGETV